MFGVRFEQLGAISHWDDGDETVEIKTKPWLTQWEPTVLAQVRTEFHPRALGYRFLERDPSRCVDVYARPFLVWLYLRLCLQANKVLWGTLKTLYWWGIIHKVKPHGLVAGLRDLRLGPGREYKY